MLIIVLSVSSYFGYNFIYKPYLSNQEFNQNLNSLIGQYGMQQSPVSLQDFLRGSGSVTNYTPKQVYSFADFKTALTQYSQIYYNNNDKAMWFLTATATNNFVINFVIVYFIQQ